MLEKAQTEILAVIVKLMEFASLGLCRVQDNLYQRTTTTLSVPPAALKAVRHCDPQPSGMRANGYQMKKQNVGYLDTALIKSKHSAVLVFPEEVRTDWAPRLKMATMTEPIGSKQSTKHSW